MTAIQRKMQDVVKPHRRRIAAGLAAAGLCLVSQFARATDCIVSDPYTHTGDQPIAGTYSTASGSALATTTVDTRAFTLFVTGYWPLSLFHPGLIFFIH